MTQGQSQVNLLSIKQFAKICRSTPKTLRLYEKKGLILPAYIDPYNKYRFYAQTQARDFIKIKLLQDFDLSLKEIKNSIDSHNIDTRLQNEIITLENDLKEKLKEVEFLKQITSFYFTKADLKESLQVESVGPFTLFCYYIEKAEYLKIAEYIAIAWKEIRKNGLKCRPINEMTIYFDGEYSPRSAKIEIAVICEEPYEKIKNIQLPKNFYIRQFPKIATFTHTYKGPYEYLPLVFQKLDAYVLKNNIRTNRPVFEMYLKEPPTTKSKFDYVTKIFYPIDESSEFYKSLLVKQK